MTLFWPSIWPRIRGLVYFGWLVALIRFGLEPIFHPDRTHPAFYFGVYTLMPIAFIVAGIKGTLDDLRWPKIAFGACTIGFLVWGVPNMIAYTAAPSLGWTHGRFTPPPNMPVPDTFAKSALYGLTVGGITTFFGALWSLIWMTLVIWWPGVVRRRRKGPTPVM
jgi:hypothetical protein